MATSDHWEESEIVNGFQTVEMKSWKHFSDFVMHVDNASNICWRGQRCDENNEWLLESAFDRKIQGHNGSREDILKKHRKFVAYAFRGRLENPSIRELKKEIRDGTSNTNHLWAVCRHHGLSTPLLDWTKSPFVAVYFAFSEAEESSSDAEYRFVYALKYQRLMQLSMGTPDFDWFDPLSCEFARLLSQTGMFTITSDGRCIKEVVEERCKNWSDDWVLMKIKIPNKNREEFLKTLNLMNINHLMLFPDSYGASEFCNTNLEIGGY